MNKETYLTEYPKHESMRENVKKDKNRLHFHMMPPTGWMNDPNGLCEFQGVNHIYSNISPFLPDGERSFGDITQQRIGFIIKKKSRSFIRTKNGTETVYIADQPIPVKMEFTIFTQEM